MSVIAEQIAQELKVKATQVNAAINLLDNGATVPFIARYRKEATQGLDDNHLRELAARLIYLRDLDARRQVILSSIQQQNKLTPQLAQLIESAGNKTQLEDLYLPYKPKRRTKGQIAIEAGIEPLANSLFNNWQLEPMKEAEKYINLDAGFGDEKLVLDGASYILAERFCENANLLQKLRSHILKQAHLTSYVVKGKNKEASKFRDYFEHSEKLNSVPSHRLLAMLRGKNEGILQLKIEVDPHLEQNAVSSAEQIIYEQLTLRLTQQKAAKFLINTVRLAWKNKLSISLANEILSQLRDKAEKEAIKIFAENLSDLLMAAPAGPKVTLGLDPGLRTGCKLAIVDTTGKLLHTATIFPHSPQNHWDKSIRTLINICRQYKVELVAIGNGTGSRESDKLVGEALAQIELSEGQHKPKKVMVSEAGASVYSASEFASKEFPDLDVSIRGAVSIARRLQDPLAELVKIDPKAIGVGQYQHDVSQSLLSQSLDAVVEDSVNAVGVDLNSASAALLSRVAGLNKTMANNIVSFRDKKGAFKNRKQLNEVARLGPKAFEQAAGFLRINGGDNPLDQYAVHPETYPIVEKIMEKIHVNPMELINNLDKLQAVNVDELVTPQFGKITIKGILDELHKPTRDPRPEFKTATYADGITTIADLKVGMVLEGVVSNVANFGAFVDIGVHQDGLVHISAITNKFINDPREIIKAGDIVKVKVVEVDVSRKRINLTMRLEQTVNDVANKVASKVKIKSEKKSNPKTDKFQRNNVQDSSTRTHRKSKSKPVENAAMGNAFADAFAKLKK